jgi:DNA-binding response OmpR family regulator
MNTKLEILKRFNVLIAEDDEVLLNATMAVLKRFFKNVFFAKDGQIALDLFKTNEVHICILDLRLPKIDGVELASLIKTSNTKSQIIIATNHQEVKDFLKLVTLDIADYITKPIGYDRLIEALLKCVDKLAGKYKQEYYIRDNICYNYDAKTITHSNERPILLTKTEYMFLELLLKTPNIQIANEQIDCAVWNYEMSVQALRNTVLRLRKKLREDVIVNVHNQGYMIT